MVRIQGDIDEEVRRIYVFLVPIYLNIFTLQALWREIGIWKRLRHDFIVPLLGTTTYYSPVSIVSSWMPNGTLMSYLKKYQVKESLITKYNLVSFTKLH